MRCSGKPQLYVHTNNDDPTTTLPDDEIRLATVMALEVPARVLQRPSRRSSHRFGNHNTTEPPSFLHKSSAPHLKNARSHKKSCNSNVSRHGATRALKGGTSKFRTRSQRRTRHESKSRHSVRGETVRGLPNPNGPAQISNALLLPVGKIGRYIGILMYGYEYG